MTQHREPRPFDGSAEGFAQAMLDEVMSADPQLASRFVFVNAWDSDREGVFVAHHIAGRASHDPEAPAREAAILNLRETLVGTSFSGLTLPAGSALVLRTDFSDDDAWDAVCEASAAETPEGFMAGLSFVSDPVFTGITAGQVAGLTSESYRTFLFLADHVTVTDPEMPLVTVDLHDEPGRWFRVAVGRISSVENNLSLANMFFREFADAVDADGVFRGFPGDQR